MEYIFVNMYPFIQYAIYCNILYNLQPTTPFQYEDNYFSFIVEIGFKISILQIEVFLGNIADLYLPIHLKLPFNEIDD